MTQSNTLIMDSALESYSDYRSSGIKWLGDVPTHWELRRMKVSVANIINQTSQSNEYEICLALEDVESWTGRYNDTGPRTRLDSQVKQFRANDVLFGKLRPYLAKVVRPDKAGICVSEFLVLRPRDRRLSASYLEQLLRSKPIIDAINSSTFGAKMPRANWQFISNIPQPLPLLPEQAAIVRYLNHATECIRSYINDKQRIISLLEEQRQAVIHRTVTRGLDPNVRLKPSGVEWLGDMPAHWECRRLKTIGRIRYGLGQPPRELSGGLPLIRATNVDHGHIIKKDLMYVDPSAVPKGRDAILREKEIIVVRSGAYTADSAIIPKAFEGAVTGYDMVVTITKAVPEFVAMALLCAYMRDDQLIVESTRSAQPHLNAEELGTSLLLLPPLEEQSAIVEYLDKVIADINTATSRAHREIELLKEYRTRLVADVVTGKLDVREAVFKLPEVPDELGLSDKVDDVTQMKMIDGHAH